jgi:hypothetical protein
MAPQAAGSPPALVMMLERECGGTHPAGAGRDLEKSIERARRPCVVAKQCGYASGKRRASAAERCVGTGKVLVQPCRCDASEARASDDESGDQARPERSDDAPADSSRSEAVTFVRTRRCSHHTAFDRVAPQNGGDPARLPAVDSPGTAVGLPGAARGLDGITIVFADGPSEVAAQACGRHCRPLACREVAIPREAEVTGEGDQSIRMAACN